MKSISDFTTGKIASPLFRFAMPILAALFLQSMYGAVDLLVVGQFGDAADVSAVATGSQIMNSVTSLIVGLSMGTTVLLGRQIGEGRAREAGDTVGASVCLFAVIAALLTLGMTIFTSPVARLMRAPEAAFDQTVTYLRICSAGTVCIVAFNVLGSVFRGIGNSRLPLVTVMIACVVNIAGDLLFVGAFGMGVAGAALATVLAQALSVLLSLMIIYRQGLPFAFSRACLRFQGGIIRAVTKLGAPIALQDVLVSASFLVITAIVNHLGLVPSAGVGVAERLCGFIMLVPSAYAQALSAFVAQNIGAKKPERARRALLCGIATSLLFGVTFGYLSFFHGAPLAGLFARDPQVIAAAADYLRSYAIDCVLVCFLFCFIGYFNGCGKTTFVMWQGMLGAFGVRIPVSYVMSRLESTSLFLVGLATPCSTLVQITLCTVVYLRARKREKAAAPKLA